MSKILLYGPEFSYFLRAVRLLLMFKGLEHEVTRAPYGDEIPLFSDQHAGLHPFRKMPVLIEGDLVLPETLAIARYLEDKPGPSFIPGDSIQQAEIISLACMISMYAHKAIVADILLEFRFPKGPDNTVRFDVVKDNLPRARTVLDWVAERLGERNFIYGDRFTLADAYLIPMLDYLHRLPEPWNLSSAYPNLCGYIGYHRVQYYSEGVLGQAV